MLAVMAVTLYTSRVVLDILGIEDYGIYNVVGGVVTLFAIMNGALSSGSSRFITFALGKGDSDLKKKTFSASFVIHLCVALIVLLFAETIGLWYVNNILVVPEGRLTATNWLYQFSIIACMLSLTQVPYGASIIAHERMKVYAWVGVIEAIYKLVIVYLLLFAGNADKLILFGALILIWSVANQLYYRYYCYKHFEECRLVIVKEKKYYSSMLAFSLWDIIGNLCSTGLVQGVNLLANFFFGVSVNAARSITVQVENAVSRFTDGFLTAVEPQIVKLYAVGDISKMRKLIYSSSKFAFLLLFALNLPVFVKTEYILGLWLVKVPEYTVIFIRLLIIIRLFRAFARPIIIAVHATGNIKRLNLYAGLTSLLLNLPITYLFFRMGYEPYISYIVSIFVNFICTYLELKVLSSQMEFSIVDYIKKVYLVALSIALLSMVAVYYINSLYVEESFYSLIAVAISSFTCNAVLTYYIACDADTRSKIVMFIKNKIQNVRK